MKKLVPFPFYAFVFGLLAVAGCRQEPSRKDATILTAAQAASGVLGTPEKMVPIRVAHLYAHQKVAYLAPRDVVVLPDKSCWVPEEANCYTELRQGEQLLTIESSANQHSVKVTVPRTVVNPQWTLLSKDPDLMRMERLRPAKLTFE